MFVLISEVRSKFRIIKILLLGLQIQQQRHLGIFVANDSVSRPMHLWSTLQCSLWNKAKEGKLIPSWYVLDSQADSHWSTVLQRLQDNTEGQIWKSWLAAQPQGLAQAWEASCVFVHFSGKWHSHSQPRGKFFLLVFERCAQLTFGRLFQLFATSGLCDWWTSKPQRRMHPWLPLISTEGSSPVRMRIFWGLSDPSWADLFGHSWNSHSCCSCRLPCSCFRLSTCQD